MFKKFITAWKSDNRLDKAWQDSYEALGICHEMFLETVRIFRESNDVPISRGVRKKDKLINRYQREIRREVLSHYDTSLSRDFIGGMILVSIIIDIERIGDNLKNILDLTELHPSNLNAMDYDESLLKVEKDIKWLFDEIVVVLKIHDVSKGRGMMAKYKAEIRGTCEQIICNLVQGKVEGITTVDAVALALYARYLKRISAHLNNIATSVVNPFDRIGYKEKKTHVRQEKRPLI